MSRARVTLVAATLMIGCQLPNPDFDHERDTEGAEDGGSTTETSPDETGQTDPDPGTDTDTNTDTNTTPGDGDGDEPPGDGDGDVCEPPFVPEHLPCADCLLDNCCDFVFDCFEDPTCTCMVECTLSGEMFMNCQDACTPNPDLAGATQDAINCGFQLCLNECG